VVEEITSQWERLDKGNDAEAWGWAFGLLGKNTTVPLATSSDDGPRVRPVTAVLHGDRVYVLTGTKDAKIHQLEGESRFEFYVLDKVGDSTGYARFRGIARPQDDPAIRREVGDACGFLYKYFDSPDDPDFTLLWMDITSAEVMRPGRTEYELITR
jgi:uncharacterized pyridoxamine 5'-phosphate oxidase family protein